MRSVPAPSQVPAMSTRGRDMGCGGYERFLLYFPDKKRQLKEANASPEIEMTRNWNAWSLTKCLFIRYIRKQDTFSGPALQNGVGLAFSVWRALAPYFSQGDWHHEETEGFFTYRIADRRGHHSDHRGHRHSELDAVPHGRE